MNFMNILKNPIEYLKAVPHHIKRSKIGAKYITPQLKSVGIELSNCCNLKCKMCTAQQINKDELNVKRGFMSFSLFKKIIDECVKLGIYRIGLNYSGESLLHPEIIRILKYVGSFDKLICGLNTNGDLLTSEIKDAIVENCKGTIGISIEGFKNTHESIRIGSKYDILERNIKSFVEQRNKMPDDRPQIKLNLTKSTQSSTEINKFIDYWLELVDYVQINECYDEEYRAKTFNIYTKRVLEKERLPCRDPFQYLAILWDGRVTICCNDLRQIGLPHLNALEMSIKEVWKSDIYRKARYSQANHDYTFPSFCNNCDEWVKHYIHNEYQNNKYRIICNGPNTRYYKCNS